MAEDTIVRHSTHHRGQLAARPPLVPSSFRGLPEVMDPLMRYAESRRRTLNSQLDIIFDNALANKSDVKANGKEILRGKETWVAPSEVAPKSFRTEESKLEMIRVAAKKADVGLSDWINMAIYYCLNNDLLEP